MLDDRSEVLILGWDEEGVTKAHTNVLLGLQESQYDNSTSDAASPVGIPSPSTQQPEPSTTAISAASEDAAAPAASSNYTATSSIQPKKHHNDNNNNDQQVLSAPSPPVEDMQQLSLIPGTAAAAAAADDDNNVGDNQQPRFARVLTLLALRQRQRERMEQ